MSCYLPPHLFCCDINYTTRHRQKYVSTSPLNKIERTKKLHYKNAG